MKIGILSSLSLHYECVGFLCDIFKGHEISIFFTGDRFGYTRYFCALYPNIELINTAAIPSPKTGIWDKFDYLIKLTSGDKIIDTDCGDTIRKKLFSIMHLNETPESQKINYITLSPFVKNSGGSYIYILPVYRGLTEIQTNARIDDSFNDCILHIGACGQFDPDVVRFIKEAKYKVVFCPAPKPIDVVHPNVCYMEQLNTPELIALITRCRFILGRKPIYSLKDRFAGSIALALSHNKPMIASNWHKREYNIPCISFEEDYCEVLDQINNLTTEEYKCYIDLVVAPFREYKMNENRQQFMDYLATGATNNP